MCNTKDQFGYRLISYDGKIQSVQYSDLGKYRADDSREVMSVFSAQNNRLADNGIFPAFIAPAKAGGLLVGGFASEAEKILDAAFGVQALDHTARAADRATAYKNDLKSRMLNSFDFAASGQFVPLPLKSDFKSAARADNENIVRPSFGVSEEMRLAA
ncbi:MAG TPA: hypothetical protein VFS88_09260 [Micavibrio sp.]|nr:hypothetical protein [Micavibrio sp.]